MTPVELICTAGKCSCGAKIVRGLDDRRELTTVDVRTIDAAAELTAWAAGRPSYVLDLARPSGLTLTRRTTRDIVRRPVGFKRERVLLAHQCKEAT